MPPCLEIGPCPSPTFRNGPLLAFSPNGGTATQRLSPSLGVSGFAPPNIVVSHSIDRPHILLRHTSYGRGRCGRCNGRAASRRRRTEEMVFRRGQWINTVIWGQTGRLIREKEGGRTLSRLKNLNWDPKQG